MSRQFNGAFIKKMREDHGLSMQRLATVCGVSRQTIQDLERGTGRSPNVRTLEKILTRFPLLSANKLFMEVEEPAEKS